jgi:galactokinase
MGINQQYNSGKIGQTGSPGIASSIPLPLRIPRLASIAVLYAPEVIDAQILRYRRLNERFFANFPERKGEADPIYFSAPGRTELCGNHTDHNNGKVLAASIDLDTVAAAAPRLDSIVSIISEGFGAFMVDLADLAACPDEKGGSAAIVRGMAAGLAGLNRPADLNEPAARISGFDAYIQSEVLPGSGLSSSAAFEMIIGAIIAIFSGIEASPAEIARIGQFAENEYFGKPCGLMDQMACALGSVSSIDFGDPASAKVELLRFDPADFGLSLVIVATGGSHADLTDDYASIPSEMKQVAAFLGGTTLAGTSRAQILANAAGIRASCGDRAFLRAWHFAGETERPDAIRAAIDAKDIGAFLSAVRASGDSSAKYLQNLFSAHAPAEQGLMVALALTEDFLNGEGACRVHGGGFAGTIQAYIPTQRLARYRSLMESVFSLGAVIPLRIRPYGVVCIENAKGESDER